MGIVTYQRVKTSEEIREERIAAMWLLFLRCPNRENRDETGAYHLGEIGETKSDRGVERWCPYAPATGLK
jgi:hypothetical protein